MQNQGELLAKLKLHFIEADTQIRAEFVKIATSIGHHCELYEDFAEIASHPPRSGIIFVRESAAHGGIAMVFERLLALGIWLPVVAMDSSPHPSRVVQAVKQGALDYLVWPLRADRFAASIERISKEANEVSEKRWQSLQARTRISGLSGREREVLEALAKGGSNKEIARLLEISPRTVEIHRSNMMNKLGARSAADAVRMRLEAVG